VTSEDTFVDIPVLDDDTDVTPHRTPRCGWCRSPPSRGGTAALLAAAGLSASRPVST
jgi:hypothetical protein